MSMLCLYTYMNLNVFQLSDSSSSTLVQTLREPVTQPWPYSTSCVQLPSKFRLRYVYVLHSASIDDLCIRMLIISDIKNDIEHQHLFNVFKDLLSFQGIFKDLIYRIFDIYFQCKNYLYVWHVHVFSVWQWYRRIKKHSCDHERQWRLALWNHPQWPHTKAAAVSHVILLCCATRCQDTALSAHLP